MYVHVNVLIKYNTIKNSMNYIKQKHLKQCLCTVTIM